MAMLKIPPNERDHRRGDPEARVVLVEYGDYQCPYCGAAEPVVEALLHNFGEDLQQVFRHFPLTEIHPMAEVAAQTAEFAGEQGAFWTMHEALFANQRQLSLPVIFAIADAMNLSQDDLRQALETGAYAGKVREDFLGGVRSGVNGTPCFFVNGVRHDGPHDFESLAQAVLAARTAAVEALPDGSPRAGPHASP
jgi:protein-disulfide isomerase